MKKIFLIPVALLILTSCLHKNNEYNSCGFVFQKTVPLELCTSDYGVYRTYIIHELEKCNYFDNKATLQQVIDFAEAHAPRFEESKREFDNYDSYIYFDSPNPIDTVIYGVRYLTIQGKY